MRRWKRRKMKNEEKYEGKEKVFRQRYLNEKKGI